MVRTELGQKQMAGRWAKVERSGLAEVRAGSPAPSLWTWVQVAGPFAHSSGGMPSLHLTWLTHCLLSISSTASRLHLSGARGTISIVKLQRAFLML